VARPGNTPTQHSGPPRWSLVAFYVLAGSVLHGALLLAPTIVVGLTRRALGDPAVLLFLVMATGFYLADLPTLAHACASTSRPESADDVHARREGFAAGLLLLATFWTALLTRSTQSGPAPAWSFAIGGPLLLVGVAVRGAAVWTLGQAFTTEVSIDAGAGAGEGRRLVEHGVYRWVRHPSETGNLAFALGASLELNSPAALLVVVAGVLPLTLWRLRREERCLAVAHGPRFQSYARRVKRLIPWVC
jgi:protein-S-isoprenylcysteine O-methyltransferase Ste14